MADGTRRQSRGDHDRTGVDRLLQGMAEELAGRLEARHRRTRTRSVKTVGAALAVAAALVLIAPFGFDRGDGDGAPDSVTRPTTGEGTGPVAVLAAAQQNLNLPDLPNPYRTVTEVLQMPPGRTLGSTSAVDVDSQGNIWLFERCGTNSCLDSELDPVMKFDPAGNYVFGFGAGMFVFPHGLRVDGDDNVWVVDAGVAAGKGSRAVKFSPTGEVLLELGEAGVRGDGTGGLLNEPSDLAIAPNGEVYVADGHTSPRSNARVARFAPDGRFLSSWGRRGDGPGEFDTPHSIAIDSRGRVFVADRSNNRIQIFTADGTFLDEWRHFGRPSSVRIHDDVLYVSDSESRLWAGQYGHNPGSHRGIRIGSVEDGRLIAFIPDPSPSGVTSFPEGIAVDADGTIWGASVGDRAVWKWVPQ